VDFDRFERDEKTADAVIRNFQVVGEAARRVPEEVMARHPEIPWPQMRGTRDLLVHEYASVRLSTSWHTVEHDRPPLVPLLRRILAETDGTGS
jgi:uncharacterized protein with HEPN domain